MDVSLSNPVRMAAACSAASSGSLSLSMIILDQASSSVSLLSSLFTADVVPGCMLSRRQAILEFS